MNSMFVMYTTGFNLLPKKITNNALQLPRI